MALTGFRNQDAPEITDKLREVAESLYSTLSAFCCGRARAKKAPELCRMFSLSDAELRACIHWLREGALVCSDSAGYYTPETLAEAERTIAHLRERRNSLTRIIDKQTEILKRARLRAA